LRDVSWDARQGTSDEETSVEPGENPDDLRQRVRETRERLRARLDEGRDDDDREE